MSDEDICYIVKENNIASIMSLNSYYIKYYKEPIKILIHLKEYILSHYHIQNSGSIRKQLYLQGKEFKKDVPEMVFRGIKDKYQEMQKSENRYHLDNNAKLFIGSSQTACVNLFMPILNSNNADALLKISKVAPPGFERINREKFFNGYRIEYTGCLCKARPDVAIAYLDNKGTSCLWLIEHKLLEKGFKTCSIKNEQKNKCKKIRMCDVLANPNICLLEKSEGIKYWEIMKQDNAKSLYDGVSNLTGCPFSGGLNQIWRYHLLAIKTEKMKNGEFEKVHLSVAFHHENENFSYNIEKYKTILKNDPKFTSFTTNKIVEAASQFSDLKEWGKWYNEVYFGIK